MKPTNYRKRMFNNRYVRNILAKREKNNSLKYKALFKRGNYGVVKYKRTGETSIRRSNPEGWDVYLRREIRQTPRRAGYGHRHKEPPPHHSFTTINRTGAIVILNYLKSYVENRQDWYNLITGAYKCTRTGENPMIYTHTVGV
jgi:hypothetical protein